MIVTLVLVPALLLQAQGTPPATPLTLVTREGRRPVQTTLLSGQELIALDDIAALFGVAVAEDPLTGGVTVSYRGRTVVASADQPMASVNGRIVSLASPIIRSAGRWLAPVEFLPRALGPIYDQRIDLRRASRLLIVGDVDVPRVTARIDAVGPPTRATVDISPAAPVNATVDAGRVILRIDADALDLTLPGSGNGLIEQIRPADEQNAVTLVLAGAAGTPRVNTTTVDGVARVVVEVPSATAAADAAAPPPPAPAPSDTLASTARRAFQTVVLDPGHGGEDVGVSVGGIDEKALTLDVAHRIRQRLETRLGLRVILTRDDDRSLPLDQRAAAATISKADLLVSLHANGALGPQPAGAEVFYLRLDQEGEDARRDAAAEAVTLPVLGGGRRTIDVIRWDLAQAAHVESSAMLAVLLDDELRSRVPMSPRAIQEAPMRVLTGANMPAALVEMAYLTNPGQASAVRGDEFKNAVADAVYDAIVRFRAFVEEQQGR